MRRASSCLVVLCALGWVACGDDSSKQVTHDADVHDADVRDSGPVKDAGLRHADAAVGGGKPDAAAMDASTPRDAAVDSGAACQPGYDDLDGGADDAGVDVATAYPRLLSETGLYADIAHDVIAADVRPFQPKYVLWSDGAVKRRWLRLPPCTTIDTSDMDFWDYPIGTTAFKEFSYGGKRVETRMLRKTRSGWIMIAYQWNADFSDAVARPGGVVDANGTMHDIPSQADCMRCHGGEPDRLLGVTALQLSHEQPGLTLSTLIDEGRLSAPPKAPLVLPGDAATQAALGYLHANCGHCHNPHGEPYLQYGVDMQLLERASKLGSVKGTTAYSTTVGHVSTTYNIARVIAGDATHSLIIKRMSTRDPHAFPTQMPPLATEVVDTTGLATITAWINALPH